MRGLRLLTGIAAGVLIVSCGGGSTTNPDVPTPGDLVVSLGENVPDNTGAIEVTVTGATKGIDTITAASGYSAYSHRLGTKSFRTVLVGAMAQGTVAVFHVPDTRKIADYSVVLTAAANATTYALMNTGTYTVSVLSP